GASTHTSAGIPDFCKPGTGPYYNLQPINFHHQEAGFEVNFFHPNPHPFFTLAKLFHLGLTPAIAYAIISLTASNNLLPENRHFIGVPPKQPPTRLRSSHASSITPDTRLRRRKNTFLPDVSPSVRLAAA
ncbi:hypothetical protein HOY80DRAFT_880586, partial [Tuber brumale]